MLGKARKGSLIPLGERSCGGVRDPRRDPKFLCGCKRPGEKSQISVWVSETRGDIPNFCVGVKDQVRYPEFLCWCKRPEEKSQISVWV